MNPLDQFDVIVRQGEHGVAAMIPALHLYASGTDLVVAIAALEQRKQALSADLSKAGILQEVIERAHNTREESDRPRALGFGFSLALFATKAAIVIVLIAVVTGLGTSFAAHAIRNDIIFASQYAANVKIGGHQFWTRVRYELHRQASASSAPPPAEKQQLLSDIRVVVNRWRPLVHEAMLIFAPPDQSGTQHPPAPGAPGQP